MGDSEPTGISLGIAIGALRARDHELETHELFPARLARQARERLEQLHSGSGAEQELIKRSTARLLCGDTEALEIAADDVVKLRGVASWKAAWLDESRQLAYSKLTSDGVLETLSRLSAHLISKAAAREPWAVRLMTVGAAKLSGRAGVSARLAPAIVWFSQALGAELSRVDGIPAFLSEALDASCRLLHSDGQSNEEGALLRLAEELRRLG